jgi:ABC-type nitrate/sulfonate/bicarbonate transport system permease component
MKTNNRQQIRNGTGTATSSLPNRTVVGDKTAFLQKKTNPWVSIGFLTFLLVVWEIVCRLGYILPLFLPAPSDILQEGIRVVRSGELYRHVSTSLVRIVWGFVIACTAGLFVGIITAFFRTADAMGTPLLAALYPIPKIAILPLLILWLGIGETSKVAVIALGVFFPFVIYVYAGVKHVDTLLVKAAISLGSSRAGIVRKVLMPAILPMIFAGMKMGIGIALLLVVAAEMVAADSGIGYMILHAADLMNTKRLMVGLICLSCLGLFFNWLFVKLEAIFIPWK